MQHPNDMRPCSILDISQSLEDVAYYGAALPRGDVALWLQRTGIARPVPGSEWVIPTASWLDRSVPAVDRAHLLRMAALRDSRYRGHIDLAVARVLHMMGASGRWSQLEQLLFHECPVFAPRFAQLIEWQMCLHNVEAWRLGENDWRAADSLITGNHGDTFHAWDVDLWGDTDGVGDMFQLLRGLYVPLITNPVHVDVGLEHIRPGPATMLAWTIAAARDGEGVSLAGTELPNVNALRALGLPVRVHGLESGRICVTIVGALTVHLSRQQDDRGSVQCMPVPAGLPSYVRSSCVTNTTDEQTVFHRTLWEAFHDRGTSRTISFAGIDQSVERWPDEPSHTSGPWLRLPGRAVLATIGKPRKLSENADQALLELADHPSYGLILQLLILEALDRELGDETLVVAPPIDRKVVDIEASTQVLYRPRSPSDEHMGGQALYRLGDMDDVLERLAHVMGIDNAPLLYARKHGRSWSRILHFMITADLVAAQYDRWTLSSHVIDRLHGGGLMTNVIRRGKDMREQIHRTLDGMCVDGLAKAKKVEVPDV